MPVSKNQNIEKDFDVFMEKNGIDVLVLRTNSSESFSHGWVRIADSGPHKAFRRTPGN